MTAGATGVAPQRPSVFEAFAAMLRDVGAVGKLGVGPRDQGGYAYRKLDDIYDALHPAWAAHGLFPVPRVVSRTTSTRSTKSGATMQYVELEVEYTVYGPAGDSFVAGPVWGEGLDTSDKATNKAMQQAAKYLLIQMTLLATNEPDADGLAPEFGDGPERQLEPLADDQDAFAAAVEALDAAGKAALRASWDPSWGSVKSRTVRAWAAEQVADAIAAAALGAAAAVASAAAEAPGAAPPTDGGGRRLRSIGSAATTITDSGDEATVGDMA